MATTTMTTTTMTTTTTTTRAVVARRSHAPRASSPRARAAPRASSARETVETVEGQTVFKHTANDAPTTTRRGAFAVSAAMFAAMVSSPSAAPANAKQDVGCETCSDSNSAMADGDKRFVVTDSGLRYLDLKVGDGAEAMEGKRVVVDWVGYTAGYQAKKIESTRETDEPFVFTLGSGEAIPGFEEAVRGMRVGGVRRIEIPGELEEKLGYSRDKSVRYSVGPKPTSFGGLRALDFVLDNQTLRDFNRTLLFDIRLSAQR